MCLYKVKYCTYNLHFRISKLIVLMFLTCWRAASLSVALGVTFTLDPASLRPVISDGTFTRTVVPWSDAGVSVLRILVGGVGIGAENIFIHIYVWTIIYLEPINSLLTG